jgi:hypothetical protein
MAFYGSPLMEMEAAPAPAVLVPQMAFVPQIALKP